MNKILLPLAVLVVFTVLIRRLVVTDAGERMMGRMMEHMPEN